MEIRNVTTNYSQETPVLQKQIQNQEKDLTEPSDYFSPTRFRKEIDSGNISKTTLMIADCGDVDEGKKSLNKRLSLDALGKGLAGAVIGAGIFSAPASIAAGALAGLGIGLYFAAEKAFNHYTGNVTMNLDGKESTGKYYMKPDNFEKTPKMIETVLTAKRLMGESISSPEPKAAEKAINDHIDPQKLDSLKPYSEQLIELAKDRRLVADLGVKSEYGFEALSVIDSNLASKIIASDKPVYIINGEKTEDIPHHFDAISKIRRRDTISGKFYEYTERKFDYSLTKIGSPEDLKNIKKENGIPDGMLGVYKDAGSYAEVVKREVRFGTEEFSGNYAFNLPGRETTHEMSFERRAEQKGKNLKTDSPLNIETKTSKIFNYPGFLALLGTTAGLALSTGIGMLGGPVLLVGIVSGKLGYELGDSIVRKIIDHRSKDLSGGSNPFA